MSHDDYDRVVLTTVADDGYPRSWPVEDLERREGGYVLAVPDALPVAAGDPACLLFHRHSGDLSELAQRQLRGRCYPENGRVRFETGSSFTLENESTLDFLRFVVDGKRRTRDYFDERNPIRWWW